MHFQKDNDQYMIAHIRELLDKRRDYRQEIIDLARHYRYVVFYGCGAILNSIVDTWNTHIGRRIDYCCDSDSAKWGNSFCGAKCISPAELIAIKDSCAVFVTIGDFRQVYDFLTEHGFPSVNLIYKYDIEASDFLVKHTDNEIAERLSDVFSILSDSQSENVFNAIVDRVLGDGSNISIMADVCEKDQYFPSDIIKLTEHESFVDIGAYNGDTVSDFVKRTNGKFTAVFSFEVDADNFKSLQTNIKRMPDHARIKPLNLGIWDSECDITYSIGNSQSTIGKGEGRAHVVPLDIALENERVSFIKMDIEGAELRALRGSENIIKKQKPKLAICIYHDFRHLWQVPLCIKKLVPGYRIYLRHHTTLEYETVCYAVV